MKKAILTQNIFVSYIRILQVFGRGLYFASPNVSASTWELYTSDLFSNDWHSLLENHNLRNSAMKT